MKFPLLDLPVEMVEQIISKMDLEALKNMSRTSTLFFNITERYIVQKSRISTPIDESGYDFIGDFRRKYEFINKRLLSNARYADIILNNGKITEIAIELKCERDYNDYGDYYESVWSCFETGYFLHINVNTAQDICLPPREIVFKDYQIIELNILSKPDKGQDVWNIVKEWSGVKKHRINTLRVTIKPYSENEVDYELNDETNEFEAVILKNIGDVNLTKRLVNASHGFTTNLELENCRTDFEIDFDGLGSFKCTHKEIVNIDRVLSLQHYLSTVILDHVAITKDLLAILSTNSLENLRVSNCYIQGKVNNEMFSFVEGISHVGFYSNTRPLSVFMWNNLNHVRNLTIGLKQPIDLRRKTLRRLNNVSIYRPETETKAIVDKHYIQPMKQNWVHYNYFD